MTFTGFPVGEYFFLLLLLLFLVLVLLLLRLLLRLLLLLLLIITAINYYCYCCYYYYYHCYTSTITLLLLFFNKYIYMILVRFLFISINPMFFHHQTRPAKHQVELLLRENPAKAEDPKAFRCFSTCVKAATSNGKIRRCSLSNPWIDVGMGQYL